MSIRKIAFLAIALFLAAYSARAQAATKPDAPEFDVTAQSTPCPSTRPRADEPSPLIIRQRSGATWGR